MKEIIEDYKNMLWNVPTLIIVGYVVAVIVMNLMANKVVIQVGDLFSIDGGTLLSWIPFLCMDIVTQKYNSKTGIRLNCFAVLVNLICVLVFGAIALIPGNGEDYSAFNTVFGCNWFILLSSTLAAVTSGIVNCISNSAIKRRFKDVTMKSYVVSSSISTFIGQTVDNFIFTFMVFHIFAPIYWGWELSVLTCVGSAIATSLVELLFELIFTPIGYRILRKMGD